MNQKLITKEIEHRLEKHPLYSTEDKGYDAEIALKLFNPYGPGTWLVTEGQRDNEDWKFFGLANINDGWGWGYFNLSQITDAVPWPGVERDKWLSEHETVRSYASRTADKELKTKIWREDKMLSEENSEGNGNNKPESLPSSNNLSEMPMDLYMVECFPTSLKEGHVLDGTVYDGVLTDKREIYFRNSKNLAFITAFATEKKQLLRREGPSLCFVYRFNMTRSELVETLINYKEDVWPDGPKISANDIVNRVINAAVGDEKDDKAVGKDVALFVRNALANYDEPVQAWKNNVNIVGCDFPSFEGPNGFPLLENLHNDPKSDNGNNSNEGNDK